MKGGVLNMVEKQFKKGDVIFREGDNGESLFDITEGTVAIFTNYGTDSEQKLTELKKGQFFGEMAVIEAYPRSATAVAEDDVRVVEVSSGQVGDYFKNQPEKIIDIMNHLGKRVSELSADYGEVCAIIGEYRADKGKKDSLIDRIKKLAKAGGKNLANIESFESKKKAAAVAHSDGYSNKVESFSKGAVIFKEGEIGDCMYDIHSGKVGIYTGYGTADEKCLTQLDLNNFFGEIGVIGNTKRSATAVALADGTTLEMIAGKDLKELFEKNPPKVEMILAYMSYRLRKLTREYVTACEIAEKIAAGKAGDEVNTFKPNLYD